MHNRSFLFLVLALIVAINIVAFFHSREFVRDVSALETEGNIGVYWDKGCIRRVSTIDWGVLSPGQTKNVIVYVRNEGNETILLVETLTNWNPANASQYLSFSWHCQDEKLEAGKTAEVTQTLLVSPSTQGISTFSFDINLEGRQYLQGDVNGDGIVNLFDAVIVLSAYGTTPRSPEWNSDADVNGDGKVDLFDFVIVAREYGKP